MRRRGLSHEEQIPERGGIAGTSVGQMGRDLPGEPVEARQNNHWVELLGSRSACAQSVDELKALGEFRENKLTRRATYPC